MSHACNATSEATEPDGSHRLTLSNMPDDGLVLIMRMACSSVQARHRVLPFVCRRWARLCYSPELLHAVDLPPIRHEEALRAAACFLRRAAHHLRELRLHIILPMAEGKTNTRGGRAWVQALVKPLQDVGRVSCLTALKLTASHGSGLDAIAPEMAGMPALTSLELRLCADLPGWLPCLTQLRQLTLHRSLDGPAVDGGWQGGEALSSALAPLVHLTSLLLQHMPPVTALPRSLAGMSGIERLGYIGWCPADPHIPPGSWQGSLRNLLLPAAVAASNLGALSAAPRLQTLQVFNCDLDRHQQQRALIPWAAQHPGLAQLRFDCSEPPSAAAVVEAARQLRPSLAVLFGYTLDAWFDDSD